MSLNIIDVKQTAFGQSRPYANHEYVWKIKLNEPASREEVLEFCLTNLRKATMRREDYKNAIRNAHSFHDEMTIRADNEFYSLFSCTDNTYWTYEVTAEYID